MSSKEWLTVCAAAGMPSSVCVDVMVVVGDGGVEISLSRLVSASLSSVVCDELDLERDMSKLFFAPS